MVELTEYTLVVLVSALFAAASVSVYGSFSKFETTAGTQSSFSSIESLVLRAAEDGNSSGTVAVPQSTLACDGGVLSLRTPDDVVSATLPLTCDFDIQLSGGLQNVSFDYSSSILSAKVS